MDEERQDNSSSNGLLLIIIAILLFGSGAVLGFFTTLFWIIAGIAIVIGVLWFISSIPRPIFFTVLAVFFLWLIIAWISESNNENTINTQPQSQYLPTTQQEGVKQGKFNLQKAKAAGLSDEYIQQYLTENPGVYVYPKTTRDAFLTNCYKESDNNISGCTCLLNYLQARYTTDEFLQIETEYVKTQQSEPLSNAVEYCARQ